MPAALITPIGQDRQILTRSGSGDPELQRRARCLPIFAHPPRQERYLPPKVAHTIHTETAL